MKGYWIAHGLVRAREQLVATIVLRLALPTLAIVSGCGAPAGDASTAGRLRQSLVGGTLTTAFPEVVGVRIANGPFTGTSCSGTVIGDYAVLTAKHCIREGLGGLLKTKPTDLRVVFGDDLNNIEAGVTRVEKVYQVRTSPGDDLNVDVAAGTDVAVIVVRSSLVGVEPRALAQRPPQRGDPVLMVGFGRTEAGDRSAPLAAGIKHEGKGTISAVDGGQLQTSDTIKTCFGDSGGPLIDIATGRVVAVISATSGPNVSCGPDAVSIYSRVDHNQQLIDEALQIVPPCIPEPETCGDHIDDDCDGKPDDRCGVLGQACGDDEDCESVTCRDVEGTRICTRACKPLDPASACEDGFRCVATDCGSGWCAAAPETSLLDGASCTTSNECQSGYCRKEGGEGRCTRYCRGDSTDCGEGLVCSVVAAQCGVCVPLGASCEHEESCPPSCDDAGTNCSVGPTDASVAATDVGQADGTAAGTNADAGVIASDSRGSDDAGGRSGPTSTTDADHLRKASGGCSVHPAGRAPRRGACLALLIVSLCLVRMRRQ